MTCIDQHQAKFLPDVCLFSETGDTQALKYFKVVTDLLLPEAVNE